MRCALFIPIFVVATILMGFLSSICALFDRSGRTSHLFARYWSRFIFAGVGIRVNVTGAENIPKDQTVIFAANHMSTMDIPAMFGYLPVEFRIMAKRILFLIPFLGWHLFLAGNIPVDRQNTKKAFESLLKAAAKLKKGVSLLVFAEGTRSRDGKLHRFKRGSFTLAKKMKVLVVPVAIMGSYDLMPANAWLAKPGVIQIVIMPPVQAPEDVPAEVVARDARKQLVAAGLQDAEA